MLTAVIVAHPDRIEWAEKLAAEVDGTIVLDTEKRGAGWNHRRALQVGIDSGATHILSLEDDALPVPDLVEHVERAIGCKPDQILGLYVGRSRPKSDAVNSAVARADELGASWLTYSGLLWGVATIWPTPLASSFLLQGVDEYPALWDLNVKRWGQRNGHGVSYCWPSLVDHRDGESVVGYQTPSRGRVAHRTGIPAWNDVDVAI